ncbi:MAG TPA: hypothetical protein VGO47_01450 [Chlamydiales bacterium]|nr:hypothetical protein [Chlamydiales bacterium]
MFHFKVPYPTLDNHIVDGIFHLIVEKCPNLEKLCLNFRTSPNPTNLDEVWKRASWKHLRSLYLGVNMTLRDAEDGNLFRDFMACHPGLECLEYFGHDALLFLTFFKPMFSKIFEL